MADQAGALVFPVPVPGKDEPVGDPLLRLTLDYLQAVVNAKCAAAWARVAPTYPRPVNETIPHDPTRIDFAEKQLPALYGWRAGGTAQVEWMAEDIGEARENLMLLWVAPPAQQAQQKFRDPFVNALAKAIGSALLVGRDPAWKLAGDTDPDAGTHGSLWVKHAFGDAGGAIHLSRWRHTDFVVDMAPGAPRRAYQAVEFTIAVTEYVLQDESIFPESEGVSGSITTADGVETGSFLFD